MVELTGVDVLILWTTSNAKLTRFSRIQVLDVFLGALINSSLPLKEDFLRTSDQLVLHFLVAIHRSVCQSTIYIDGAT